MYAPTRLSSQLGFTTTTAVASAAASSSAAAGPAGSASNADNSNSNTNRNNNNNTNRNSNNSNNSSNTNSKAAATPEPSKPSTPSTPTPKRATPKRASGDQAKTSPEETTPRVQRSPKTPELCVGQKVKAQLDGSWHPGHIAYLDAHEIRVNWMLQPVEEASSPQPFSSALSSYEAAQQYYNYTYNSGLFAAWMNLPIAPPELGPPNFPMFWPTAPGQELYAYHTTAKNQNQVEKSSEGSVEGERRDEDEEDEESSVERADEDDEDEEASVSIEATEQSWEEEEAGRSSDAKPSDAVDAEPAGTTLGPLPYWCRVQNTFLEAGFRGTSAARSRSAPARSAPAR